MARHALKSNVSHNAGVALLLPLCMVPATLAQDKSGVMRDCAQWLDKKGDPVDDIEQRMGQRPSGNMAQSWRSKLRHPGRPTRQRGVHLHRLGRRTAPRAEVVDGLLRGAEPV